MLTDYSASLPQWLTSSPLSTDAEATQSRSCIPPYMSSSYLQLMWRKHSLHLCCDAELCVVSHRHRCHGLNCLYAANSMMRAADDRVHQSETFYFVYLLLLNLIRNRVKKDAEVNTFFFYVALRVWLFLSEEILLVAKVTKYQWWI